MATPFTLVLRFLREEELEREELEREEEELLLFRDFFGISI